MTRSNEVIKAGVPDQIRDWMRAHPDGGLATEIAKALGQDPSSIHGHFANMVERGELTKCIIERPNERPQAHFRATALLGNVRRAFPWKEFRVDRRTPVPAAAPVKRPPPVPLVPAAAPPVAHLDAAVPVAEEIVATEPAAPPTPAPSEPRLDTDQVEQPRFALYSDGTLVMEGLPHLPDIVVLHRDHARLLLDYLAGEVHA